MIELTSLSIENFRSFNEPQTIEFAEASKRKITMLYGSNAAGKSNVVKALKTALNCIAHSSSANWRLPYEPFLLNSVSSESPSCFKLAFRYDNRSITYSFSFDGQRIVEEKLQEQSTNSEKQKTIFARDNNGRLNSTAAKFKFGKRLAQKTRADTLLITKAREDNNEYANIVFSLLESISIVDDDFADAPWDSRFVEMLRDDEELRSKTVNLLNKCDFAIRDIAIRRAPLPEGLLDSLPIEIPPSLKSEMMERGVIEFKTIHAVRDGEGTVVGYRDFDFGSMESMGTRKFFEVAVPIIDALDNGKTLFIDEFSSYIHPNLAGTIVSMFKEQAENMKPAKLVVITHNTAMMDSLDRDEVILMEKTLGEESRAFSLKDAGARKNDAFEKRYRAGYYGGVPQIHI